MKIFIKNISFSLVILFCLIPSNLTAQTNHQGITLNLSDPPLSFSEKHSFSYLNDSSFTLTPVASSFNYTQRNEIDYLTLAGVGAITIGAGVFVHIYQANAWWKDQRRSFHFQNDWDYALWFDKVGHFFAGSILAHGFSSGLEAANFDLEQSAVYGSVLALLYQTYVEIEDGFGPDWGFSPGDAVSNTLGAGYTLAQYYFPYLKNFQFKFSYWPSNKPRFGNRPGNGIDDYEGQKYWLSFRMENLLPESFAKWWPDFLCIAAGLGVKDLHSVSDRHLEYYIAFDFDAETIPLHGKFWQFLKNSFNYIHLPMPGVRITPNAAFFVFCY